MITSRTATFSMRQPSHSQHHEQLTPLPIYTAIVAQCPGVLVLLVRRQRDPRVEHPGGVMYQSFGPGRPRVAPDGNLTDSGGTTMASTEADRDIVTHTLSFASTHYRQFKTRPYRAGRERCDNASTLKIRINHNRPRRTCLLTHLAGRRNSGLVIVTVRSKGRRTAADRREEPYHATA